VKLAFVFDGPLLGLVPVGVGVGEVSIGVWTIPGFLVWRPVGAEGGLLFVDGTLVDVTLVDGTLEDGTLEDGVF